MAVEKSGLRNFASGQFRKDLIMIKESKSRYLKERISIFEATKNL